MKRPQLKPSLGIAAALVMALFAVQGGEYSSLDLLRLRDQVRTQRDSILALRTEVDSLTRLRRALETDPATQERVAREVYGMIRPGERLYQVVPAEGAGR